MWMLLATEIRGKCGGFKPAVGLASDRSERAYWTFTSFFWAVLLSGLRLQVMVSVVVIVIVTVVVALGLASDRSERAYWTFTSFFWGGLAFGPTVAGHGVSSAPRLNWRP